MRHEVIFRSAYTDRADAVETVRILEKLALLGLGCDSRAERVGDDRVLEELQTRVAQTASKEPLIRRLRIREISENPSMA
jgi:hypothetical protein